MTWARRIAGGAGLMPAAAVAAAAAAWGGRLPDPMATHFGPVRADGATGVAAFTAGSLAVAAAGGAALAWAALARGGDRHTRRAVASTAAMAASLAATLYAVLAATQADVARWQDARMSPWWWPVVVGVPLACAVVAGRLAVRGVAADPARVPDDDALTLRGGQRAVWTSGAHASWMLCLGAALLAAAAGAAVVSRPAAAVPLALSGLACVELGVIRVRVDGAGLTVRYGPLGVPATRVRLARIASATATDVRPMRNGGWGYRGSLRILGWAAVVLRAGPGIAADLRDGGRFVVTVDDAGTGAALLDAEVRRAAAGAG